LNLTALAARLWRVLATYADRLAEFSPNARLYLIFTILIGAVMGVYRLLFNFFLLSLGYDNAMAGTLTTVNNLTALIVAVPMGYLVDRIGHKTALIVGGLGTGIPVALMAAYPSPIMLFGMTALIGFAQSLTGVTMGPFLMENSSDKERVYVFSFSQGLMMASSFVGNWAGGSLPTWLGAWMGVDATDALAYAASLIIIAMGVGFSTLPLFFLRTRTLAPGERSLFAPFSYLQSHKAEVGRPILPILITSIGAGLIMPFMNLFFRQVHNQPDPVIGTLFAASSLSMGIGLLIAPLLAERFGKIQLVVITQVLSIPFLAMLGFSPWFGPAVVAYFVRAGLMNMSGPVYQTFVMEKVEARARATVASLVSMANNFGWAFSPSISGWLQERSGFDPVFVLVIVLYGVSIFFYWRFFWPRQPAGVQPVTFRSFKHH
jgi:MFS family permease